MENRKRNVQIIVRVTKEERALIEKNEADTDGKPVCLFPKMLIDGYIILLDLQKYPKQWVS